MANRANLANSVLFAPLSDSDTTLEVYTGDGVLFPAAPFYLTISPKNKWSRKINSEIVLVTAKATDTFTITRAQKGTTAMEFSYGDLVANGIYTEDLSDAVDEAVAEAVPLSVTAALQAMMPVGFVVTLGVSTNPNTLYGFGTWTRIEGNVIVGVSDSDTDFDLNDTGGYKSTRHGFAMWGINTSSQQDSGSNYITRVLQNLNAWLSADGSSTDASSESSISGHGGTVRSNGGSNTEVRHSRYTSSNLQPYISKYVWERTV